MGIAGAVAGGFGGAALGMYGFSLSPSSSTGENVFNEVNDFNRGVQGNFENCYGCGPVDWGSSTWDPDPVDDFIFNNIPH